MLKLSPIVALRKRRLDRMMGIERAEKAAVAEAQASLQAAQNAVDDYLEATRTLELDLLHALLNKAASVNDLLTVEETLKQVKEKAHALVDHRSECQTRLVECKERARIAARDRASSARKLNKSEYIQDYVLNQRARAANAYEEAAIEEFSQRIVSLERGSDGA